MSTIREKSRMDGQGARESKSGIPSHLTRQCSLRFTTSILSLIGVISFAVAISNSPSEPSFQYVFPILSMIIAICWNTFNILFYCRADPPARPAANVVVDLIVCILLVAMNVYALVSTNHYGFSTSQGTVPDANKYGGAVGSAFTWLAAILHLIMFTQASVEKHRLKKPNTTTTPDTIDPERAARRARRVYLAKVWLRAATVVISLSGFICFVAAIALNQEWNFVALNINYWTPGQDANKIALILATDYFPLCPFIFSFILAGILFFFLNRHARKPRTTKPVHPICILIGDLFVSILLFTAILLASVIQTYMYYFSGYSGKVCTEDHCAVPPYTVSALKIAGISLAVAELPLHLCLTVLTSFSVRTWFHNRRIAREERQRNQPSPNSDRDRTTPSPFMNNTTATTSYHNKRRPSAIESSMQFQRDAMREHDPSSQDRPRKNSTASFSQMASNLRHKNRNTNTNNDDGEKCTERRGSTASFSQMASNLRRGSRSTTITNNNNTNITNTSSHDRKNSNASISQITHNFEKQGFVSPTSDDFPSVPSHINHPSHTDYHPSHNNHTRRKKSEGSLFGSREKETGGGKALERLGICKETEIVVSETARGGGGVGGCGGEGGEDGGKGKIWEGGEGGEGG